MTDTTIDSIWEDKIYSQGQHLNRYPYDVVVSFVFRNYPRNKDRKNIRILEVGCGSGNNLWFAAREGFSVTGVDGSASAIEFARARFKQDGLTGDFHVGDFTQLPFQEALFDLVIDRGALTCCGFTSALVAVGEVRRVMVPGGKFLLNPYSDRHSSHISGKPGRDGETVDINDGSLVGVGPICFYGRHQVDRLIQGGWKALSVEHLELVNQVSPRFLVHAEWRVVVQKTTD
jgi:SAM-dependent methyltransferase